MILIFEEDSEKKSESQMGFEPTTLRDLVGSNNAKACDRTHAAPPQASAAQKTNSTESCYFNGLGVHYLIRKPKKPYGKNWERIPQPM